MLKNGFTRLAGGLSVERSGRLRLSSVSDAQSAPSSPKRSTKSLPTQTNKSVLQHPPRTTSMGRLVLNVLLSFAQFERKMVSERTRDKIAAARRRGKWTGGRVVLGYGGNRCAAP